MNLQIQHLAELGSTNDYALELVESGKINGDLAILADRQTHGRGRLNGRLWHSPEGNFYCSYVVRLDALGVDANKASLLTTTIMTALLQFLQKLTKSKRIQLKLPNDIFVGGKKLAGVLVEVSYPYAIIGIGINLTAAPLETSTSLQSEFGFAVKPSWLAENFYPALREKLGNISLQER